MNRALVVVCLLLAACAPDEVKHGARVPLTVATPCRSQDAVSAAGFRVTVFENGLLFDRQELTTLPSTLVVPPTGRVTFEILALSGSGEVVGRGFGTPLEEPRQTDGTEALTFTVWPVGRFVQLCNELLVPRRGHSVVELEDGSLVVSGGLDPSGAALASLERASLSGVTEHVGELELKAQGTSIRLPRAWHAATGIGHGQIAIFGGEQTAPTGATSVLSTALVVDQPSGFQLGAVAAQMPAWSGRTRALAVRLDNTVFLVGGLTRSATNVVPSAQIDRFDLTTFRFTEPLVLPRAFEGAAMAGSGETFFLAGGTDQGQPTAKATVFSGGVSTPTLQMARTESGAAGVGPGRALIVGGRGQGNTVLGTTEWLTASSATAGGVVEPRSKPCVVALDDHRALVFGGVAVGGASAAAEIVSDDGTVTSVAFDGAARFDHTCTVLSWGAVVLVGGTDGTRALGDVWAYVP
ncbi:MAG: hypothetical protein U0228_01405 [Myxococcaceae bacterium]